MARKTKKQKEIEQLIAICDAELKVHSEFWSKETDDEKRIELMDKINKLLEDRWKLKNQI
jgi:hypothetical protein